MQSISHSTTAAPVSFSEMCTLDIRSKRIKFFDRAPALVTFQQREIKAVVLTQRDAAIKPLPQASYYRSQALCLNCATGQNSIYATFQSQYRHNYKVIRIDMTPGQEIHSHLVAHFYNDHFVRTLAGPQENELVFQDYFENKTVKCEAGHQKVSFNKSLVKRKFMYIRAPIVFCVPIVGQVVAPIILIPLFKADIKWRSEMREFAKGLLQFNNIFGTDIPYIASVRFNEIKEKGMPKTISSVRLIDGDCKELLGVDMSETGPLRRIQFYGGYKKTLFLFAKHVLISEKNHQFQRADLKYECLDGCVISNDYLLIQTKDNRFYLIPLRSWDNELEVHMPPTISPKSSIRIVEVHPNLGIIAFEINSVLKILRVDSLPPCPGSSADPVQLAAAAAASPALTPPPLSPINSFTQLKELFHTEFEQLEHVKKTCIGKGEHSKVYQLNLNSEVVVFKGYPVDIPEKDQLAVYKEYDMWRKLHHPNIVRLIRLAETTKRRGFLLEFLPQTLVKLYEERQLSDSERKIILRGICAGTRYLHLQTRPIIHRDIRASNVLLNSDGVAKLTDLGLSRILVEKTSEHQSVVKHSPNWSAPECWEDRTSIQTDVYAIGMTLLEMAIRGKPFGDDSPFTIHKKVVKGNQLPSLPADDPFTAIYAKCCAHYASERYQTASDLLEAVEQIP